MANLDELSDSLIAQRAAEWFVAHRGGELSAGEREAFVSWLKASPEHIREYLAIAHLSSDLAEAARSIDVEIEALLQCAAEDRGASVIPLRLDTPASAPSSETPPGVSRRSGLRVGLIAASLCAFAITAVLTFRDGERFGLPQTYETAHAAQTSWRLPDGSVMHLNSDSRVTVRFSGKERLIHLARGQAHFQVTHDPQRRFRVTVDGVDVIAVGTAFDVYRRPRATVVTVVEGKVAVVQQPAVARTDGWGGTQDAPATSAVAGKGGFDRAGKVSTRIELAAGQRVEMSAGSSAPELTQVTLREGSAWLQRQIVFDQMRLEDVADEFNRYGQTQLLIEDEQLKDLRMSGAFSAYDMDSFVASIRRLDGISVESASGRIEVHRARPVEKTDQQ
ncbi:FecR family protein [Povalibacter sp.]|uniref:FecR family protein n=1 Tax=Povalibacter sp. TaxID=1962978 RepID=UPI002F40F0D5